jgi:hypothetical protein
MTAPTATPSAPDAEKARLIEEILRPRHPFYDIAAAFSTLSEAGKKQFEELKAKKDADRARLTAVALPELQAMRANQIAQAKAQEAARLEAEKRRKAEAAQKEAQKEAAKFYNQASANADFGYWATMDYWTFDEALALLLGKDPRVLTRAAIKRELAPEFSLLSLSQPQRPKSEFLRRYEDLRNVAERAATMKLAQLRPVDVVLWAGHSGAITPPDELVQALLARVKRSQQQAPRTAEPQPIQPPSEVRVQPSPLNSTPLKRAALIQKHERAWPTIEADLRHSNDNGLLASAKGDGHGYWLEEPAIEWARKNGKLRDAVGSSGPVAHSPFGRIHQIKG